MSVFDRPLLCGKEIARALRMTPMWFSRRREDLYARGFPRPVIGNLYDSVAINNWLDAQLPKPPEPQKGSNAA